MLEHVAESVVSSSHGQNRASSSCIRGAPNQPCPHTASIPMADPSPSTSPSLAPADASTQHPPSDALHLDPIGCDSPAKTASASLWLHSPPCRCCPFLRT